MQFTQKKIPMRRTILVATLPVPTDLTREQIDEIKENLVAAVPIGRFGTADEAAKAAEFLASDDSSDVTGIELCVDGGMAQV
jgi:NAD(P)-dependent dehydrogenase (short-subunit alcohol dehydrogenase family)